MSRWREVRLDKWAIDWANMPVIRHNENSERRDSRRAFAPCVLAAYLTRADSHRAPDIELEERNVGARGRRDHEERKSETFVGNVTAVRFD